MMHIIRNDEHGAWGKAHSVYLIHAPCFLPLLIYSFITSAIFTLQLYGKICRSIPTGIKR